MKDYGFDGGLGMKVFLLFEAFQTTLIRFQSVAQFAVAFLKYCCLLHGSDTFVSSFKGICRTISGARKSYNRSFFFCLDYKKIKQVVGTIAQWLWCVCSLQYKMQGQFLAFTPGSSPTCNSSPEGI